MDQLRRMADGITVSNGLGWSPDGRTMYWSDTKSHTVHAFDVDAHDGSLSRRRVFASFPVKQAGQPLVFFCCVLDWNLHHRRGSGMEGFTPRVVNGRLTLFFADLRLFAAREALDVWPVADDDDHSDERHDVPHLR